MSCSATGISRGLAGRNFIVATLRRCRNDDVLETFRMRSIHAPVNPTRYALSKRNFRASTYTFPQVLLVRKNDLYVRETPNSENIRYVIRIRPLDRSFSRFLQTRAICPKFLICDTHTIRILFLFYISVFLTEVETQVNIMFFLFFGP